MPEEEQLARAGLDGVQILATIRKLERRIAERFPGSGLSRVSGQLGQLAGQADAEIARLREPWAACAGSGPKHRLNPRRT